MADDQRTAKLKQRIKALELEIEEAKQVYDELECEYGELLDRHKRLAAVCNVGFGYLLSGDVTLTQGTMDGDGQGTHCRA